MTTEMVDADRLTLIAGGASPAEIPRSKRSATPRSLVFTRSDILVPGALREAGVTPTDKALVSVSMAASRPLEKRVAKQLGTSAENVAAAAYSTWGRGITEQRDAELRAQLEEAAAEGKDLTPSRQRTLKGYITRRLKQELNDLIEAQPGPTNHPGEERHMRGHITKRAKDSYTVVVDLPRDPETGKRRQKSLTVRGTKRDAERVLAQTVANIDGRRYRDPSRLAVSSFVEEWIRGVGPSLRPTTLRSYQDILRLYALPWLAKTKLDSVTPGQLKALYAHLLTEGGAQSQGLSARTVRYTHRVLHRMFRDAVRWGMLPANPASVIDPPRIDGASAMGWWTAEQLRSFLNGVTDDRLYTAWVVAASTGMRRGEVLGLQWGDVDLDKRVLRITHTLAVVGGRIIPGEPKTSKGRRTVALDSATMMALRQHRQQQVQERLSMGPAYQNQELVFCWEDGRPINPNWLSRRFRKLVQESGLPAIRLHDLRHTHATLALQAGVHPKVISERLGHSGIGITLDTYTHAIPALQSEAAQLVADLVHAPERSV